MNEISPYSIPGILPAPCSLQIILERTADCFGVRPDDITGKSRKQPIVFARHAFCLAARTFTDETTTAIGRQIRRDHSTVVMSIRAACALIDTDFGDFKTKYELLKKELKPHAGMCGNVDFK